jgi:rod shape determining protein RodA
LEVKVKKILKAVWQYFRKLDKMLFISVCGVSFFSVVLMYSIIQNGITTKGPSMYETQFISLCLGAFIALVMSALDYQKFTKLWFLYVPAGIGLVLLTFTSLGIQVEGTDDKAWIDLRVTTLQPSEFLKIVFIMSFAYHLNKVGDKINNISHLALLVVHGLIPLGLVAMQGDDGTAIVFLVIFAAMLFSAGLSWKYILPCLIAAPVGGYILWNYVLAYHQKMRFIVVINEELDPLGYGYQQRLGKIALGSGKLFGKGLFADEYSFVPEVQTDFILTYVGQCFGFIGCIALIAALSFICLKIMADSRIAKDNLGKYMCVGVSAMLFIHCVLNIGMVLVVTPVIGVPLPFVSQGGTAMLSMFLGIGLVMSVYSHSEKKYRVFYDAN